MPTTYNGVGTHYYGKKSLSARAAICGSCHRSGNLTSYETRLWFVIFFIPVIPLGRKRIIDYCPACSRHRVADADAFEQNKQLQTSGSLDRFRREPSADAALGVHASLLAFSDHDQAAEFRRTALEQFPDHAGLRAGLAMQLDEVSAFDEAGGLFESALELEPDLPDARIGVARRRIASGELDEARQLLDFLELPSSGREHNLGPIDILATAYQKANRHEEALALAGHLLDELPQLGQNHGFRAFVRKSEKALRRDASILPARAHSLGGLFRSEGSPYAAWQRYAVLAALGVVLLGIGLIASNEYIRTHRTLHIVNATGQVATVQIDDGPPRPVLGLGQLPMAEGRHRIKVAGPVEEAHDLVVQAGPLDRWTGKPLWVLNVGGEAVLDLQTVRYARVPQPAEHRVLLGDPIVALPHVDYPFEAPPESVQVKGRNKEVVKTAFAWVQGQDLGAFLNTVELNRAAAMTFAERRLRRDPDRRDLLNAYLGQAQPDDAPRVEAFLKSGLDLRPAKVEWHRAYQHVAGRDGGEAKLIPLYDGLLASDPGSAALLYLRGRIEPDPGRRGDFYQRSIDADPKLPWPRFSRGVAATAGARWDEALRDLQEARKLDVDADQLVGPMHTARMGRGDASALVDEYRTRLLTNPVDPTTLIHLFDALAGSGRGVEIEPELNTRLARMPKPVQTQLAGPLRELGLYAAGKLDELRDRPGTPSESPMRGHAILGLGGVQQALADGVFGPTWGKNPWNDLALSLALDLEGQSAEAAERRERACAGLEAASSEGHRAAQILHATEPTPAGELDHLSIDANDKALMFAVLAAKFPERRAEYHAAAARFNVLHKPPYRLIRRALEGSQPTP